MHPALSCLDCCSRQPLSVSVSSLTRHNCLCNPSWASSRALARAIMKSQCCCCRVTTLSRNLGQPHWCVVRSGPKVGVPYLHRVEYGGLNPQIDKLGRPADVILSWNAAQVGVPMAQAVDCPPEAGGPLERTLQAKCHQHTCLRASIRFRQCC